MFSLFESTILVFFIWLSAIFLNMVVNPVYAALYLIITFMLSALLVYNLGLVLISYIYVIVYVGAIAILFLFIIMFLDLRQLVKSTNRVTVSFVVECFLLFLFFYLVFFTLFTVYQGGGFLSTSEVEFYVFYLDLLDQFFFFQYYSFNFSKLIGFFLYAKYVELLFFVGLFLFVALVLAIYLVNPKKLH